MDNFLKKRKSKIHGYGIFTLKNIKKGEKFYNVPLYKVSNNNSKKFAYIGNNKYVCDSKILNWVNHSDDPNSTLVITKKPINLLAKKNILAGEEITCNYFETEKENMIFKISQP